MSNPLAAQYRKAIANWSAPSSAGTRDMSIVAQQLSGQWTQGQTTGLLPRPPEQFIQGAFGPSLPASVTPLDPRQPNGGVLPRRDQYPVGYNLPTPPGQYKLVDFRTLRQLSRIYDIARRCINVRRQEVAQMNWAIAMKDDKATPDDATVRDIEAFFENPDPIRGMRWDTWIKLVIEEVLVTDALAIYPHLSWGPRGGRAHTDLYALEVLDGTTIKPLIDERGTTPDPPAPAYQQFLWGIPRSEFAADPKPDFEFQAQQLYYEVYSPSTDSLYGFSSLESIILNVNLALKRQQWWTSYYTDGTVPAMLIEAPANWNSLELREFEENWNSMLASDAGWKHRMKFSPGKAQELKPPLNTGTDMTMLDQWLAKITCMGFDVTPIELGLDPQSGLGGAGWSEQQENVLYRKSLQPLTAWIEGWINDIIAKWFGRPDIVFRFVFAEIEDAVKKAQRNQFLFQNAQRTPNELRVEDGLDPVSDPNGDELVVVTRQGPVLLSDLAAASQATIGAAGAEVGLMQGGAQAPGETKPGSKVDVPASMRDEGDTSVSEIDQTDQGTNQAGQKYEQDLNSKAVLQDLRNWQRKALKAVKDGKAAAVSFTSDAIALSVVEGLRADLAKAETADDVREAFGDANVRHMSLERLQDEIGVELVSR